MASTKKSISKHKSNEHKATTSDGSIKAGELLLTNIPAKDRTTVNIAAFYLDKCRRLLEPLAEMIQKDEVTCSPASSTRMRNLFEEMSTRKTFQKLQRNALAEIYDSFGCRLDNIIAVCEADRRYANAWKRLTTSFEVSSLDLKKELGRYVVLERDYGWMMEFAPEALFAPAVIGEARERYNPGTGNYEMYGQLSLRATDRKRLSDHFFGKEYADPHLTKELPTYTNLIIEDFEHATATDIMTLEGIALNGSMLGATGAVSTGALKKVKNQTLIQQFAYVPGSWPTDRVEMLSLTYFTLLEAKGSKDHIDIRKLVRFAVDDMARYIYGPIFNTFMPEWQSFTKTWSSESYTVEVANTVRAILMAASDEWMSLDNFKMQLLCEEVINANNSRYLKLFPYKGRSKSSALRKIDKEHSADRNWTVKEIDWFEEMGFKFAVHWLKYLCALGILAIAVDPDDTDDSELSADPMEGMRYVKLTTLGKFAFHIEQTYTLKTAEGNSGVDFDGANGIITIDEKSPYQMFLSNVAKRISPTRFRISQESLLKGCKWRGDLEQRILNLKSILDPEKEPTLKKIIDEAMSHTDCAQREGGYSLLRLRPDLPGLREVILTNKELREMTILAGPTLALVKTHKMDRFNTILASYGFLMD